MEPVVRILYFGCKTGQPGHHLFHSEWWQPNQYDQKHRRLDGGWTSHMLDGVYAPRDPREPQGKYAAHFVHGWTVVAWWDRSVDTRFKCNSAFLVEGLHAPAAAIEHAAKAFPSVIARQPGGLAPHPMYAATHDVMARA